MKKRLKHSKHLIAIYFLIAIMTLLTVTHLLNTYRIEAKSPNWLCQSQDLTQESFVLRDSTSDSQIAKIFDNEERMFEKLEGIFDYLEANNVKYMLNWHYKDASPNGTTIYEYTVNQEFLDLNNIQVCEGRLFNDEDYTISGNQVPVLVGKDLQEEYQLGQIFTYRDEDLGEDCTAKVVGILDEHATRLNIGFFEKESLNHAILKPFSKKMFLKGKNMASLDMALNRMVFFTNTKTADQIAKYIEKTKTFSMRPETVEDLLKEIL